MNYEKHLRRIRSKIFDYPIQKEEKADRVLRKLKDALLKTLPISSEHHSFYACE
tara:strand:+ start:1577 stop:1738 length:162 start_codon:yes stop_codon:yes gene_type:complete